MDTNNSSAHHVLPHEKRDALSVALQRELDALEKKKQRLEKALDLLDKGDQIQSDEIKAYMSDTLPSNVVYYGDDMTKNFSSILSAAEREQEENAYQPKDWRVYVYMPGVDKEDAYIPTKWCPAIVTGKPVVSNLETGTKELAYEIPIKLIDPYDVKMYQQIYQYRLHRVFPQSIHIVPENDIQDKAAFAETLNKEYGLLTKAQADALNNIMDVVQDKNAPKALHVFAKGFLKACGKKGFIDAKDILDGKLELGAKLGTEAVIKHSISKKFTQQELSDSLNSFSPVPIPKEWIPSRQASSR